MEFVNIYHKFSLVLLNTTATIAIFIVILGIVALAKHFLQNCSA